MEWSLYGAFFLSQIVEEFRIHQCGDSSKLSRIVPSAKDYLERLLVNQEIFDCVGGLRSTFERFRVEVEGSSVWGEDGIWTQYVGFSLPVDFLHSYAVYVKTTSGRALNRRCADYHEERQVTLRAIQPGRTLLGDVSINWDSSEINFLHTGFEVRWTCCPGLEPRTIGHFCFSQ